VSATGATRVELPPRNAYIGHGFSPSDKSSAGVITARNSCDSCSHRYLHHRRRRPSDNNSEVHDTFLLLLLLLVRLLFGSSSTKTQIASYITKLFSNLFLELAMTV